jgi:hypothetical protein
LGPYLNTPELTELTPLPETTTWTIDNTGLAPTGVAFEVQFVSATSSFIIEIIGGNRMRFASDFQVDDILTVDTSEATRFVGQKRNGSYIKYMELMAEDSRWISLFGGVHTIQTSDVATFDWLYFRYRTRYWGI